MLVKVAAFVAALAAGIAATPVASPTASAAGPGPSLIYSFHWIRTSADTYLQSSVPYSASDAIVGSSSTAGQFNIVSTGLIQIIGTVQYTYGTVDPTTGKLSFLPGDVPDASSGTFKWSSTAANKQLQWESTSGALSSGWLSCPEAEGPAIYAAISGVKAAAACTPITLTSLNQGPESTPDFQIPQRRSALNHLSPLSVSLFAHISMADASLLLEIQRLSGAIDRHKAATSGQQKASTSTARSHTYVNPNYKPPNPASYPRYPASHKYQAPQQISSSQKKDVVIGGVAFESSGRSLTRKDLVAKKPNAPHLVPTPPVKPFHNKHFSGPYGQTYPRVHKPRSARPRPQNMVLDNIKGTRTGRIMKKRTPLKSKKQCPFFSTTGTCARGLSCKYQHDPDKIAICPRFMKSECPNTADSCLLSHDPTPQRVPLCVHFANYGRCKNGSSCLYPHINVGPKQGVCRDFAVLGFCEKGSNCEKQHLKECPGFAETGACSIPKCKLPHVIRANAKRARQPVQERKPKAYGISFSTMAPETKDEVPGVPDEVEPDNLHPEKAESHTRRQSSAGEEEYISLTFNESSDEADEEGEDDDDDDHSVSAEDEENASEHEPTD
ncbi:hypothetical protein SISNIDRAFT_484632 [Sistotremastrum niveocremeum HHB9708]|uniref:C3H1-type domain-containing protein n=1 Tax=Sistotremastrum niveocremeum HHB9708 TaxID=1314777 RepID=A0A164VRY3_9AGAM|nr:hypothetical protein SISNIDRAFT_484632 [Sistotremastrum niveocremeum HHB9708]